MVLSLRSTPVWMLGYPEAALADVDQALKDAREINHSPSLMYALAMTSFVPILLGNYAAANAQADELVAVAEGKSAAIWKALGTTQQGWVLAETGKATDTVHRITSGIAAWRSTGSTMYLPTWLSELAKTYADLRQFDDAWRASAKRSLPSRKPRKGGGRPRLIALPAKSR
jgi:hypothetical protein